MNALRSSASAIARRSSGLSKGGLSRLTIRLVLTLPGGISQIASRRLLLAGRFSQRDRQRTGEGQFELAGDKGEDRGRAVAR